MPEISRFFGIVIRMYYDDHGTPHFHVVYGRQRASVSIPGATLLAGRISEGAQRLVREWALLHEAELVDNWHRARRGDPLQRIEPLT